ncbi:MAG: hypothetical protein M3R71_01140 [Actinomycetota bacterium]|nr:hypothetical protein [Actinomycetota bacterium]
MKLLRRLLSGVAVTAVVSLAAAACSASPYAAVIDGRTISQTTLQGELRSLAGNQAYVKAVDQQGSSAQVQVLGDAPGSYSNSWVSYVLTQMIAATAIHQHLAAIGQTPPPAYYDAARSVDEAGYGAEWTQFPVSYRNTVVQRDAERAVVEPTASNVATLRTVYDTNRKYFFTRVCTRQVDVSQPLPTASGAISTVDPGSGGAVSCYSAADLENQPAAFVNTVMGLAPGQAAAPVKTSYGYQVLSVVSRDEEGFTPAVQRLLSVALASSAGTPDSAVARIVAAAHVKVNPAYGTWNPASATSNFGVQPPPLPLSTPTASQSGAAPSGG